VPRHPSFLLRIKIDSSARLDKQDVSKTPKKMKKKEKIKFCDSQKKFSALKLPFYLSDI
jgi:hypothetical protein